MKFSLILGTISRTGELARFLESLAIQDYRDFELIIIDQNADDRLGPLINIWRQKMDIKHLRSPVKGLSRARNAGLKMAAGEFVAFPDDDCWYPQSLLSEVAAWFDAHSGMDGVSGQSRDGEGRLSQMEWPSETALFNRFTVWTQAISYTIFLKREVVDAVGGFDETLGVGAGTPWGSGEETDYLLRALSQQFRLMYEPSIFVFHPHPLTHYDEKLFERGSSYGAGMGRVLRKHSTPYWFRGYVLFRALAGALLGLLVLQPKMARFHWNVFLGRLSGLHSKFPEHNRVGR